MDFRERLTAWKGHWDDLGKRRLRRALVAGVALKPHFSGRYVAWQGGFPKPKVVNRGGQLWSGGCTLWNGVRIEVGRGATVSIGKGTYLNRNTLVVCRERVTIGAAVMISWDVVITDSDEHDSKSVTGRPGVLPVTIGDQVWVGCRAIVLKGVTIGRGSVIGAGAVVTRDIPPYSIAVGHPARVVRTLTAAERR